MVLCRRVVEPGELLSQGSTSCQIRKKNWHFEQIIDEKSETFSAQNACFTIILGRVLPRLLDVEAAAVPHSAAVLEAAVCAVWRGEAGVPGLRPPLASGRVIVPAQGVWVRELGGGGRVRLVECLIRVSGGCQRLKEVDWRLGGGQSGGEGGREVWRLELRHGLGSLLTV